MTLEDILEILPVGNTVRVVLNFEHNFLEGDVDSILCHTDNATMKRDVTDIEPRNNILWIWTKE